MELINFRRFYDLGSQRLGNFGTIHSLMHSQIYYKPDFDFHHLLLISHTKCLPKLVASGHPLLEYNIY